MLEIGLKNKKSERVVPENTAEKLGSGFLPVYATPAMILLIESTCAECVADKIEKEMSTVGTKLDIEHISATPVGLTVECECELIDIDRRKLVFEVVVTDDIGVIGRGKHERFIVDGEKFMAKANTKLK